MQIMPGSGNKTYTHVCCRIVTVAMFLCMGVGVRVLMDEGTVLVCRGNMGLV
jgi:hypothetical protein